MKKLLILKYVKSGIYLKDKEVQEFLKEKKTHESIKKLKDLVFILKKEKKSENNMNHFCNHQTAFPSQEDKETSIYDNLKMETEKKK